MGSGSALPTKNNFHASQVFELRGRRYMIDCGEGTQIKLNQYKINLSRLDNIFISHLHSDHCIGLMGLISTLAMLGRKTDLNIYAYKDLKEIISPMLKYFSDDDSFNVVFHDINPNQKAVIYEDKGLKVSTIPLKHRVPTCGFLFEEQQGERHLIKSMIEAFDIPIKDLKTIKQGADFIDKEGFIVSNEHLTTPADPIRKYAYISDTLYTEKIIDQIAEADILFHESTFVDDDRQRAKETLHTTALQAAQIARKANVKQLILGHFSARYRDKKPFLKEAKSIFENTILAEDGLQLEF